MFEEMKKWAIKTTMESNWKDNRFHEFRKTATQQEFLKSQIPFFYAVQSFPRLLCLLASKIPTSEQRMDVVENIWEEHGQGNSQLFHTNSYRTYLKALGLEENKEKLEHNPWVSEWIDFAFNRYSSHYEFAAYLAGIEYLYALICTDVVPYIESMDLKCEQTHYKKHSVLDWEHGAELFKVACTLTSMEKHNVRYIKEAFIKAQTDFLHMYGNLFMPTLNQMQEISKEKVAFYYSREHSETEIMALDNLFTELSKNPNILMICSGGEHIFEMMAHRKNISITAIDINPHQIELAKNKLNYLTGEGNDRSVIEQHNIGKFEKMFALLRSYFTSQELEKFTLYEDSRSQRDLDKISYIVETLFSNQYLNAVFTDSATKYTIKNFAEHFTNVFTSTLSYEENTNNIFNCAPIRDWKQLKKSIIKNKQTQNLNWVVANPKDYTVEEKFDIIDISNIGDWMTQEEFADVLKNMKKHLAHNGVIISRKLLGDYDLVETFREHDFRVESTEDRTLFYTETVVAYI